MDEPGNMTASGQEFCLRWNNFHSSLISALDGFKNDLDFVDVTLACEGQFLKAHKMLLSACSVFFRDLLKANPCQHPIVILPPEVRFLDLEKMLRFIYQGEVNVQQENLPRFLKTAEMLKIRGLAEDSEKKAVQPSSPRSHDGASSDVVAASPKRPRLSMDPAGVTELNLGSNLTSQSLESTSLVSPAEEGTKTTANTSDGGAGGQADDSDSEMIPVKQEMIELKECDFDAVHVDGDAFLAEAYLREATSNQQQQHMQQTQQQPQQQQQQQQGHPSAPPPPGPLMPSYVPPPHVKAAQDDSFLTSAQDNVGHALLSIGAADLLAAIGSNLGISSQHCLSRYNSIASTSGGLTSGSISDLEEADMEVSSRKRIRSKEKCPMMSHETFLTMSCEESSGHKHLMSPEGGKRWRCRHCHSLGHEKRTRLRCRECGVALCYPCCKLFDAETPPEELAIKIKL